MDNLSSIVELVRHGAAANELVMGEAAKLTDEQLDRPLDLGMGSVRRICQHVLAGEVTWLARMKGEVEARWPARPIPESAEGIREGLRGSAAEMHAFLEGLPGSDLARVARYRDSAGSLFETTLHGMLLQFIVHSTHHRAQIVNGIRRVGGHAPELDYMYLVRRPAS